MPRTGEAMFIFQMKWFLSTDELVVNKIPTAVSSDYTQHPSPKRPSATEGELQPGKQPKQNPPVLSREAGSRSCVECAKNSVRTGQREASPKPSAKPAWKSCT